MLVLINAAPLATCICMYSCKKGIWKCWFYKWEENWNKSPEETSGVRQKLMKKLKQHMAVRLGSNASCTLRRPVHH